MSTQRKQFLRLALDAVTSRLGTLAGSGFALVLLSSTLATGWADRRARSAEQAPLAEAHHLPEVLAKSFSPDVVQRLESLAPMVMVLGMVLMALAPLLGAAYSATLAPRESTGREAGPFVRLAAVLFATTASATLAVVGSVGLACGLFPGLVAPWAWLQLGPLAGAALLAALPSVATAIAIRDLVPKPWLGVPMALGGALVLRYGLPMCIGDFKHNSIAHWLVPRSYELPLLAASPARVLTNAALCLVWACALLLIDVAIKRKTSPGLAGRSHASIGSPATNRLPQPEV